jgi:WD40 repeat protein
LSPDGRYLVVGLDESIVWLEYPSLKTVRRVPYSPVYRPIGRTAFSPDGRVIATCDPSSNQLYLSSRDGNVLGTLDHAASVLCIDFSPDGRTLVTGDSNNEVHIWDVARRQERAALRGHSALIHMVRF